MLEINGIKFEVNIERKPIKRINMRLKGNRLEITCPYTCQDYEVYNFINSKKMWIYNVYNRLQNARLNSYKYFGGDTFYIFGKPYKLVRSIGRKKINIINDTIYFTYKDDSEESIKALYKYLDKKLLEYAKEYINKYRYILDDYGYYLDPNLTARVMTSKWGVCFMKKNKITFSSYLIHYPLICLECIAIHELVHFIVGNHSKRFYEIVNMNMSNYNEGMKILRQ